MKKTVFIVTEQRASVSEKEAKEILRQRVERWLKEELKKSTNSSSGSPASAGR